MTLAVQQNKNEMVTFSQEQNNLIKSYLCKGITDDELKLFSAVCKKTGLDPFMKQIYAVKRQNRKTGGDDMTIQTSIDGYRLIAERTGRYAPGRESSFQYDKDGRLLSATSYIKKQTQDGTWHEIGVTAFLEEYKPAYSNQFWDTKSHVMLAKCAESLALRKAFPNELSGLYSDEEMQQADSDKISYLEAQEIESLLLECPEESRNKVTTFILSDCKVASVYDLKKDMAKKIKSRLEQLIKKTKEIEVTINA